jgi:hypothetical protein
MTSASRRMHRKRVRELARCPDCSSDVLVRAASDPVSIDAQVFHDPTCPWFTQRAAGEPFREVRILNRERDDQ